MSDSIISDEVARAMGLSPNEYKCVVCGWACKRIDFPVWEDAEEAMMAHAKEHEERINGKDVKGFHRKAHVIDNGIVDYILEEVEDD